MKQSVPSKAGWEIFANELKNMRTYVHAGTYVRSFLAYSPKIGEGVHSSKISRHRHAFCRHVFATVYTPVRTYAGFSLHYTFWYTHGTRLYTSHKDACYTNPFDYTTVFAIVYTHGTYVRRVFTSLHIYAARTGRKKQPLYLIH